MPIPVRREKRPVKERLHFATPHVEGFKCWLHKNGYTVTSVEELVRLLAGWTDWMHTQGYDLDTILIGYDVSTLAFKNQKKAIRRSLGTGALFIRYLREHGVTPQSQTPLSPTQMWPLLAEFRLWMRTHRGIAETTLDTYQTTLVDFVKALGGDPAAYSAEAVRAFVLQRATPHGRGRAQGISVATRSFLRFLVATDRCPTGLDYAIPGFANWQLASVPRYLVADDVERIIGVCEHESRLRDKAILLLLARLGLRASEVAGLEFGDVDWKNGQIVVAGKSRCEHRLPLTQEVGDAIIAYMDRGRPVMGTAHMFLTKVAPLRPITRITVKCIVRSALKRAGVDSAHKGAHVLRHSAATAMLRSGVSLAGVGAVLRHTSPTMTMHYAKVDMALLSEIARPWEGRLPC